MQERQTKQKQIIYDALKTLNHPTATEVYAYVHSVSPTVSRATVFRVLGGFAQSGRALELKMAGSEVHYDYNVMPHYHARCMKCGKVADVCTKGVNEGGMVATNTEGFEVEGYTLEFFGTCKECLETAIS
jgi:Fe2+ or Zn2+ uptake regulation protein